MSLALLCPGQGTLGPEVLPWLDEAPGLLPTGWRAMLAERQHAGTGPWPNAQAQALVVGLTLAAWQALQDVQDLQGGAEAQGGPGAQGAPGSTGPAATADPRHASPADLRPTVVVGYSVGELAAAAIAGACSPATALALAGLRAAAMDAARGVQAQGLLAVHGSLPTDGLKAGLNDDVRHGANDGQAAARPSHIAPGPAGSTGSASGAEPDPPHAAAPPLALTDTDTNTGAPTGLHPAIHLAADRCVYGGPAALLDALAARLEANGIRHTRLAIDIASHTPWMAPAVAPWRAALEVALADGRLQRPRRTLLTHADIATPRSAPALADALARQLVQPIDWPACMDAIAERGVRAVLELGPGRTLSTLWRERHPHIPARSADEFRSATAVRAWVHQALRTD
ncbi:hypothetical protein [Pseudaquabacterium rugosum]|uniref:Malonyl-CoA:ACP transacylase (MAT) domain-containing protein n=1 Tax=Pseudaquabacterium rugosum TaxID=2984194 RepID=A0ABU9BE77_9BURK